MRPLQLEGIKRVGCEVLFALSRREDRKDELIAAWRRVEPGDADAVEVFVEPRGPAPSFLFQPLLQGRVEDHELVPYVSYARHAGLPKYGTLALCLSNALREGIRKFDGARRASALQVLNPALQQVLELEDDDPDDVKEWAGFGLGLQNTLRGFLLALTAIGRFFDDTASSSSELLNKIPGKDDLGVRTPDGSDLRPFRGCLVIWENTGQGRRPRGARRPPRARAARLGVRVTGRGRVGRRGRRRRLRECV